MSDLRGAISGSCTRDIASYFGCSITLVVQAIHDGAKTWQDVHDYICLRINGIKGPNG